MNPPARHCPGFALVLGLLLLAALSLLAVMAANGMVLQRRMAANFEDRERALANAGLATAAALAWLYSRADFEREAGCTDGCLLPPAVHDGGTLPERPEFESASWWRTNAVAAGSHPETGEPAGHLPSSGGSALWLLEEIHFQPLDPPPAGPDAAAAGFYRVLGRGSGRQAGSVAVSEAIVARPWQGDYRPADYPPPPGAESFCRQFDPSVPCGTLAWRQRK